MQVEKLEDPAAAKRFYETRYEQGYMDVWGNDRRRRLRDVLADVELPAGARVLDFGCGSGALTATLAEFWPHVDVHGADISATAVANARERVPAASFHVLDANFVTEHEGEFDFVFSHHVLEHVYDLPAALADLVRLSKPTGRMLHALPCGNAGSLAQWLCLQRPDGIQNEQGNRFFFEESSHLRRLQSNELRDALLAQGCELSDASYGYHWLGVLRLMTEMTPPAWFAMVDPRRCHLRSLPMMLPFLLLLGFVAALRAPTQVLLRARRVWSQVFRFRTRRLSQASTMMVFALAVPSLLLLPISAPVEIALRLLDSREWRRRRKDPAASEMFLMFQRRAVPLPRAGSPVPELAARVEAATALPADAH